MGHGNGDRRDSAVRVLVPRGQGGDPQRGVGQHVQGEASVGGAGLLRGAAQSHEELDARLHPAVRAPSLSQHRGF